MFALYRLKSLQRHKVRLLHAMVTAKDDGRGGSADFREAQRKQQRSLEEALASSANQSGGRTLPMLFQ